MVTVTNRASPAQHGAVRRPDRRAPVVRDVVRAWRRLTGGHGGRTVVACSGGADSSALLLSLASVTDDLVVAYIRHDLRGAAVVEAEEARVRELASMLGLPLMTGVAPCGRGNAEAGARRARYAALAALARRAGAPWVATGHHADDQLETMVMALLRGAGPAGLRGVAPVRPIERGATDVRLVRPMLGIRRADAEGVCAGAGWAPCIDETNGATERMRAALRHGALRELSALRPRGAAHAARSAEVFRDLEGLLGEVVVAAFGEGTEWARGALRPLRRVVIGAGLRRAACRVLAGEGEDGLGGRTIDPVVDAVKDDSTEPRVFEWPRGVRVLVTASTVRMERA